MLYVMPFPSRGRTMIVAVIAGAWIPPLSLMSCLPPGLES
jgi:hypothetical protein